MADLAALQAQRSQIIAEIQRRGGRAKAPGFQKQLEDIEGQIRSTKAGSNPASQPPVGPPAAQPNIVPEIQGPANPPPETQQPLPGGGLSPVPTAGQGPDMPDPGNLRPEIPTAGVTPGEVKTATGKIKNAATGYEADQLAAEQEAGRQTQLRNPDQYNPYGSSQTRIDENGNVVQEQKLSEDQQKILDGGENLTQVGQKVSQSMLSQFGDGQFNPELAKRTSTGDMNADRQRIEDVLYEKMTRDVDRDASSTKKQKEQELYNKGIAYNADPNSRYQQELSSVDKRYDRLKAEARQNSVQMGGEELKNSFGINEQTIANQLSQAQGIRNQRVGEISSFQNLGTGLINPNFSQYQAADYNPTNPMESKAYFDSLDEAGKARLQQLTIAKLGYGGKGPGGGSTGGTKQPAKPVDDGAFSTGGPPGL